MYFKNFAMRLILLETLSMSEKALGKLFHARRENCESDAGASVESIFRHYLAKSAIARAALVRSFHIQSQQLCWRVAAKSFRSHR